MSHSKVGSALAELTLTLRLRGGSIPNSAEPAKPSARALPECLDPMLLPPIAKRPTYDLETALHARGLLRVAGIDEVGRGPLAGPVVAAAVVLSAESAARPWMARVHDSKLVTPRRRVELAGLLKDEATGVGIGEVSAQDIDRLGIVRATHTAMLLALKQLSVQPDFILIDGRERLPSTIPQQAIVKGDRQVLSIAAASIVAKVYRDALMEALSAQFPGWGFDQHKGYGSPQHLDALRRLGPSPIHRRTFGSVNGRLSEHGTRPP